MVLKTSHSYSHRNARPSAGLRSSVAALAGCFYLSAQPASAQDNAYPGPYPLTASFDDSTPPECEFIPPLLEQNCTFASLPASQTQTNDDNTPPETVKHTTRLDREGGLLAPFLRRLGFTTSDIYSTIIPALNDYISPNRLSGRQEIIVHEDQNGELVALEFPSLDNPIESYVYDVNDNTVETRTLPHTQRKEFIEGTIVSSFYRAMDRAGAPDELTRELIRLYSWDVNWQRDMRYGDKASVLFSIPETEDGRTVPNQPDVIYARLTVNNDPIEIFRYENSDGDVDYYKYDGTSIRRSLLRTPIDGARLSSGFGPRIHPVLGFRRNHNGTDFAAPIGTPIYAAGDGTVTFRGREPGDGNLVRIEHGNGLVSGYSHLNGFARGLSVGDRVRQGQTIGYVGMTGTATGPHLHYSIKINGRFVNPETVDLPEGNHLEGEELARFEQARDAILEDVRDYQAPLIADNNAPNP